MTSFEFQTGRGLSPGNFFQGSKSIVMQISIVILLFSDQISWRGKSFQGLANCLRGGGAPPWEKASVYRRTRPTPSPFVQFENENDVTPSAINMNRSSFRVF